MPLHLHPKLSPVPVGQSHWPPGPLFSSSSLQCSSPSRRSQGRGGRSGTWSPSSRTAPPTVSRWRSTRQWSGERRFGPDVQSLSFCYPEPQAYLALVSYCVSPYPFIHLLLSLIIHPCLILLLFGMYKTFFTYNVSNVQYHLLIMPRTCFTCVNHIIFFLGLRPICYCCKHFLLFVGYHLLSKGVTLGRISDLSHVVVAYRRISAAVHRIRSGGKSFCPGSRTLHFCYS